MGEPLSAASQIYFHQRLVADRQRLLDPVERAIGDADSAEVTEQLDDLVPQDILARVRADGFDPAIIFPTPAVITQNPAVIGHYRLLLGTSKKSFYDDEIRRVFRSTEERGTFARHQRAKCPALCERMCAALAELIRSLPDLSARDIVELPLLTLGAQYEGAWRVLIGQRAEAEVFEAFFQALRHVPTARKETAKLITLTSDDGTEFRFKSQRDPDVTIERLLEEEWVLVTAVEVKGGRDRSNAHNRAGEAEKSHAKTDRQNVKHWTIAMTARLDAETIAIESGRTDQWFDVEQIRAQSGPDWDRFRVAVADTVGVRPV